MWLPFLFGVLAASNVSSVAAGQPAAVPASYRVIELGNGAVAEKPAINAKGQVALSMGFGTITKAMFYDGKKVQDLGNLGGTFNFAVALNDNGQVVGYSTTDATNDVAHAFAWDKGTGMIDLGALPGTNRSLAFANNNRGEVVGAVDSAVRWTLARGLESLGTLGGRFGSATAINDAGMIAGWSEPAGNTNTVHAFVWTKDTGMTDIHPPGVGGFSFPFAVSGAGQVTGWSAFPGTEQHAFLWTREGGMLDIGASSPPGAVSLGLAMSRNGRHVAGIVGVHAMAWSRDTGMVDLGTFGGRTSRSFDVNNRGQVVGSADIGATRAHAFVWTAADGLVDLNDRLRDAPPGLELGSAVAVSDNGSIVAYSNQGLILLKPHDGDEEEGAEATNESPSEAVPSRDACARLRQGASMFGRVSSLECALDRIQAQAPGPVTLDVLLTPAPGGDPE